MKPEGPDSGPGVPGPFALTDTPVSARSNTEAPMTNPARTSGPLLVETPQDPAPEGAVVDFLEMSDGTRIRVARWSPSPSTAARRGTVLLLNGRTEFIEKSFETIENLQERGFAVATLDWRGQGLSDRPLKNRQKGYVEHFDQYVSDLEEIHRHWVEPHCPAPYSLLAHSMGGNIALHYAARNPAHVNRAIFSAPMFGIGTTTRPNPGLRLAIRLSLRLGLSQQYLSLSASSGDFNEKNHSFEKNALTHDRERFARVLTQIETDPRLALGAPTFGWIAAAFAATDALFAPGYPEAIRTPIHIVTAGLDSIVSEPAQAELAARLPCAQRSIVEGARHELLLEADSYRERFFEIFDAFTESN